MPIDPQSQRVLDQDPGFGDDFDPAKTTVQAVRRTLDERQRALAGTGPQVARVEDRDIPGPAGPIPVRIYWPVEAATPTGIYVYLHSGGYIAYGIETADPGCRVIANAAGCIVVSVAYRLAPEAKFPAAVDDCFAAVQWSAAAGTELGAAKARLAVGGESCGGAMASVVSMLARDAGGPALAQVVMCCPLTHLWEPPQDTGMGRLAGWFRGLYLRSDEDEFDFRASPQHATDVGRLPPTLIVTGEYDPLRPQGEAYAAKLRAARTGVEYAEFAGMIHNFTGMGGAIDKAGDGLARVAGTLRRAFGAP